MWGVAQTTDLCTAAAAAAAAAADDSPLELLVPAVPLPDGLAHCIDGHRCEL